MDQANTAAPWIADAMVVIALFFMTVGVFGLATMPDIYLKLHAASKAVVLGAVGLMIASFVTRDTAVIARAVLIICALLLTAPISSHAIANSAVRRKDRMRTDSTLNESPFELDKPDSAHVGDSGDARLRTLLGE
ncbi:MAG: monovalent cation/H(+) antiporter subunit G [Thermomicrobiales bacterium]|jgi:monovalent cation/proton antiporter MnhG/PhaG subunit|nr:monovalent cation/H(+) antiporter subunit G [Thermomicrobiales bacterium]